MSDSRSKDDLLRCMWKENPIFVQVLGLCPTLAITNTVENCVMMGLATMFVLVGSSTFVSMVRKLVPSEVRIATYILIIATFVTIADMTLEALAPGVHKALGAFVPLIVVNCIILGRAEAFASKNSVWGSFLDAIGNSIGFMGVLLVMGTIREVIGYGTFLGQSVFGPHYEPWGVMVLPPAGFLTLGSLMLGITWWQTRKAAKPAAVLAAPDAAADEAA